MKEQKLEHLEEQARALGEELHELRDLLNEWCGKLADLLTNLVNLRVYLKERDED
jgi:hypothetical protein